MTAKHAANLVRQASKAVGSKGSPTVQTGLLVELDSAGRARFTGSDYYTCLTTWEEEFTEPETRAVVDPKFLVQVLNGIPAGYDWTLTATPAGLSVAHGRNVVAVRGQANAADFQTLPEATGAFCELSADDLSILERVAASCASSELPSAGNACVHLLRREGTTLVAATDGKRIAFCRRPLTWGGEPPAAVAVPADALRALKGLKPDAAHPVLLVANAERVTFTNGCFTLTTTQGNADRGATIEKFLSNLKPWQHTAGADAAELRAVLLRAGVVAKRATFYQDGRWVGGKCTLEELPGGELAVAAECESEDAHTHPVTGDRYTVQIQATFSEVLESGESHAAKALPVAVNFRLLKDCLPKVGAVILGFQGDVIGVVPDDDTEDPLCWLVARIKTDAEPQAAREAAKRPNARAA